MIGHRSFWPKVNREKQSPDCAWKPKVDHDSLSVHHPAFRDEGRVMDWEDIVRRLKLIAEYEASDYDRMFFVGDTRRLYSPHDSYYKAMTIFEGKWTTISWEPSPAVFDRAMCVHRARKRYLRRGWAGACLDMKFVRKS